jgi:peptide/nickel transport system substrate-binding protein
MKRFETRIAALAIGLVISSADPAAAENVLRYTSLTGGAVTLDPYSAVLPHHLAATKQVYEALLDIDSNLAIVPQLALALKPLNPTTWEFELRPDVTFHDGTPFTAEDVVFSIGRAGAEAADSQIGGYVAKVTEVEAVDDHTIHITTSAPDPLLWLRLSYVAIMSKAWAKEHGATTPADYNRRGRRPTPLATPTAPARSCSRSSNRTADTF